MTTDSWRAASLTFPGLLLLVCLSSHAQKKINHLVFEGAGIRGIAYCGAIRALEERQQMGNISSVGGTSAGAITALCVSLGYRSSEISELLYHTDFKKFNDGRFLFPGGINRLNKNFGWYRGERFEKWIRKIIETKTGNPDITFEELTQKGFKDLYVTATVLNRQRLVIPSRKTYPRMRVCDAVRISASIPLYFEAVFVNQEGVIRKRPKDKNAWDIMVDGGFTGNFPIRIFDSVRVNGSGQDVLINEATVGFRIDSDDQIRLDSTGTGLAPVTIGDLKQYTWAFYNMIIENLNRQPLTAGDWKRTVSISDGAIRPKIRKLRKSEIDILIANGYNATIAWFSRK